MLWKGLEHERRVKTRYQVNVYLTQISRATLEKSGMAPRRPEDFKLRIVDILEFGPPLPSLYPNFQGPSQESRG